LYRTDSGYRKISLRYRPTIKPVNDTANGTKFLEECQNYLGKMAELEFVVNTKTYDTEIKGGKTIQN